MIPLVDLRAQHDQIWDELQEAFVRVTESSSFVGGPDVESFEAEFADFCGVKACVGVANGTDALSLALEALDIGQGDEVITVPHTFIATTEAIASVGATPVFVDVRPDTMLMDPGLIEAAITPRTKAIIPVHLYGQMCDMDEIMAIARRRGLLVIEDAAQAQGASWNGNRAGTFGDVGCFSFYPGKNLGALGDAGAVVSNNPATVEKIRLLSNHGSREKYTHEKVGVNSRLDGMQAAFLRVKLRHLDQWNESRRSHARSYLELLREVDCELPAVDSHAVPVWHLFVVRVPDRDRLRSKLTARGIGAGIHYPVALHLQPAYASMGFQRGDFPVSERAADQVLSLPMYPELTEEQINTVSRAMAELLPSAVAAV